MMYCIMHLMTIRVPSQSLLELHTRWRSESHCGGSKDQPQPENTRVSSKLLALASQVMDYLSN